MSEIQKWKEEVFQPWKKQAEAFQIELKKSETALRQHANSLKYIVSLLLEKRESEAVAIWNNIGLNPELMKIELNLTTENMRITTADGRVETLQLSQLLSDLEALLSKRS